MKNSTIAILVVLAIIIAGGAWLLLSQGAVTNVPPVPAAATDAGSAATTTAATTTASTAPMSATVHYNGQAFSPSTVTVVQGGTVTFVDDAGTMWVASDPHPVHSGYDGTTRTQHCAPGYTGAAPFDECSAGASFSFIFNKVGSWGYHDHLTDTAHGTVVVVGQ